MDACESTVGEWKEYRGLKDHEMILTCMDCGVEFERRPFAEHVRGVRLQNIERHEPVRVTESPELAKYIAQRGAERFAEKAKAVQVQGSGVKHVHDWGGAGRVGRAEVDSNLDDQSYVQVCETCPAIRLIWDGNVVAEGVRRNGL